jgi:glutathione peroxidase
MSKILKVTIVLAVVAISFAFSKKDSVNETTAIDAKNIYEFKVNTIDGEEISLEKYKGKVVLIVNVASKCGFTPQYEGLQKLYSTYKDSNFVILGFPCNQFMKQEPGTNAEIKEFCSLNYGVTFPMFDKIDVNGDSAHPLYKYLKSEQKNAKGKEKIAWNFTKFLVNKEGKVIKRIGTQTKPADIEADIKALL